MARLIFPNPTPDQLKHICKAELELIKAGVRFDVSSVVDNEEIVAREWELDWSMEGATIKEETGGKIK